jgi:hypothetical protein
MSNVRSPDAERNETCAYAGDENTRTVKNTKKVLQMLGLAPRQAAGKHAII